MSRLLLCGFALAQLGCQPYELAICPLLSSSSTARPAFEIRDLRDPARPDYLEIRLADITAPCPSGGCPLVWHARGTERGSRELRYGEPPRGFREIVPARTLEPGRAYHLVVTGRSQLGDPSSMGDLAFHLDPESGAIVVEPGTEQSSCVAAP